MPDTLTSIGTALNFGNIFQIQIADGTWAYLAHNITTVEPLDSDETEDLADYACQGVKTTEVTGGTKGYKFSGSRQYGDPAQDYVCSLADGYGTQRETKLRHIAPNGKIKEGTVVLANIVDGGGDALAKGTFEFEASFKGLPSVTQPQFDYMPTAIACADVAVNVGETATLAVTPTPAKASNIVVADSEDPTVATVDIDGTVHGVKTGTTNLVLKCAIAPTVSVRVGVTVSAS